MKRWILLFAALCLVCSLAGCGKEDMPQTQETTTQAPVTTTEAEQTTTQAPTTTTETEETTTEEPLPDAEPYVISACSCDVYRVASGAVWARGMVAVTNTGGTPLYLDYGTFQFAPKDNTAPVETDHILPYPQIIAPGETGYYYDVVELDSTEPIAADLVPRIQAYATSYVPHTYEITDLVIRDSIYESGMEVSGVVTNGTEETAPLVCVGLVYFDPEGTPTRAISTILPYSIAPGESQSFSMSSFMFPDELRAEDFASYEIFAFDLQELG